jgi:hypothetical protein
VELAVDDGIISTTISSASVRCFKTYAPLASLERASVSSDAMGMNLCSPEISKTSLTPDRSPKIASPPFGCRRLLCRHQDDPEAGRRNKSDFAHVKEDPWICPAEGRGHSRFQIWAGRSVESSNDTKHRHCVCHFGSDFQFNSSGAVLSPCCIPRSRRPSRRCMPGFDWAIRFHRRCFGSTGEPDDGGEGSVEPVGRRSSIGLNANEGDTENSE